MISLTITTCKRLYLFKKTIFSLQENLIDINLFDSIIHYDDSSSQEDRKEMENIINQIFPNSKYISRYFEPTDFKTNKRHAEIMNIWKEDMEKLNVDFAFHTEDDWEYLEKFSIIEAIDILKNNKKIALIAFSENFPFGKLPPDIFYPKIIGNFWECIYIKEKKLLENLYLKREETVGDYLYWEYYINWPYFTLRPSIHDVKKLSTLDNFKTEGDVSFELEFSTRFAEKYVTYFYMRNICKHISGKSAYELNNSNR